MSEKINYCGFISVGTIFTDKETVMKEQQQKRPIPSDAEIIQLYNERNEAAIKSTDDKYGKYLTVIGNNILCDMWECEECLNDTYLATWNRIPPQKPRILQAFLSKIMRDISVSLFRKKHASKRVPPELVVSLEELGDTIVSGASVEEDLAIKRIGEILNGFLADMGKRERFIFICRYYYCDKVSYIAEMLGVSEKTVYRELADMRASLKVRFDKEEIEI